MVLLGRSTGTAILTKLKNKTWRDTKSRPSQSFQPQNLTPGSEVDSLKWAICRRDARIYREEQSGSLATSRFPGKSKRGSS